MIYLKKSEGAELIPLLESAQKGSDPFWVPFCLMMALTSLIVI